MRGTTALAVGVAALLLFAVPASAQEPQPPGDIGNVELIDNIPLEEGSSTDGTTAINFIQYGHGRKQRDIMFVVGTFGLKSYDLADPAHPRLLDELGNDDLMLTGDTAGTFWQNEDMDVDQKRKLVFLARDPRAYEGTTQSDTSVAGVYIIDARNPGQLGITTFHQLPTGHTSTCVNDCDYLWTGGPATNASKLAEWPSGRPIIVTDIRDPENPKTSPQPVDLFRNDGETAYSHDVQVDAKGIAWVSGLGGTRGYWTEGKHYDPLRGERRRATATDPIPFAGGAFEESATPSGFMHNAMRPVGRELRDGPDRGHGYRPGELLLATEEADGPPDCNGIGQFVIGSLEGSYEGQAWRSTPEQPFRLKTVGTWNPHEQEGTSTREGIYCSAHYFDAEDGILAYSWYDQGTRFIDVSDPTNPIQVAYYRPDDGVAWAPYFHGDYVYVADHERGLDVLKVTAGAKRAGKARKEVKAPKQSARQRRLAARSAAAFAPDPQLGWACPLPRIG